jgi:hypothetical protein
VLLNRTAADRDVSDEVQHDLDQDTTDLVAKGRRPQKARRAAQMEIGNVTVVREEMRGPRLGESRRLRQTPGFTVASVITLAVRIGAATAIFCVINGVLPVPLPFRSPTSSSRVWHAAPGVNIADLNIAPSLDAPSKTSGCGTTGASASPAWPSRRRSARCR